MLSESLPNLRVLMFIVRRGPFGSDIDDLYEVDEGDDKVLWGLRMLMLRRELGEVQQKGIW